jgi:hypothetical protein
MLGVLGALGDSCQCAGRRLDVYVGARFVAVIVYLHD